MTKIEGYEDCHIVNEKSCKICCGAGYTYEPERYEDGSISRTVYQVPCECIKNGGEIRQGEAAPVGVHSAEDDRQKTCPSPTYTREELVKVILAAYHETETVGLASGRGMRAALDALIAIGAVRVK